MKFRHKLSVMLSAAAALVIVIAVAALAAGSFNPPGPDPVVYDQPLSHSARPAAGTQQTFVYCISNGNFFHSDASCSGMRNAEARSLSEVYAAGKQACPLCIGSTVVYAHRSGRYFHALSACSGMKNAPELSLFDAEAAGKTPCPVCWEVAGGFVTPTPLPAAATPEPTIPPTTTQTPMSYAADSHVTPIHAETALPTAAPYDSESPLPTPLPTLTPGAPAVPEDAVYATEHGRFYHYDPLCSGMQGGTVISPAQAGAEGKSPCPVCAPAPTAVPAPAFPTPVPAVQVYATKNGRFYHMLPDCSGMQGASALTRVQAEADGKHACPFCCALSTPTPMPAPGSLDPRFETIAAILGADFDALFPGYDQLISVESYPTQVGSAETADTLWELSDGRQRLNLSLLEAGATHDGVLSLSFPDSAAAFRVMKQARPPLCGIYMEDAPRLLEALTGLNGGEDLRSYRLQDVFIHYTSAAEITCAELLYSMGDSSTVYLSWTMTGEGPQLASMYWNL